jgi:hypothetical protein
MYKIINGMRLGLIHIFNRVFNRESWLFNRFYVNYCKYELYKRRCTGKNRMYISQIPITVGLAFGKKENL